MAVSSSSSGGGGGVSGLQSSGDESVTEMAEIQEVEQNVEVASMTLSAAQAIMSVEEGAGQGVEQTAGAAGQAAAHGAHAS